MRRNGIGPAALAIGLGMTAAGCGSGAAEELSNGLATVTVERRSIVSSVAATGTVEPIRVIEVKSQASGEVLEVAAELGDRVARGDMLVRIDPRDVRNAFEQAEADLEVARARLGIAERQLERTRALRDSAVVTEEELENAILEHANARASLVKAETNLELAQDKLHDVTVRAPITGTVIEHNVEEGQIVTSTREVTGGTTLLRMADLAEVQVRTLVDETDIGKIEPGLPATIRVEAYPDRAFEGRVLKIEPQAVVEQNVTLFAVLTRIRNEEDLLRPGMNADVEVVVGRRAQALALPNGGIKTPPEARQLVQALGLDAAALEARPPGPEARDEPRPGGASAGAGRAGPEAGEPREAGASSLPSRAEIRAMSQEERRRFVQRLSPADRQRLFTEFRAQREREQREERADPGRPKPAFAFVTDAEGRLTVKPILIGLSNWEYTEILAGLEEGERVVEVPLSLVQQQELLERIRSRSGVPGIRRN
ncbi:MAG: efflux RND transporter periplasmic adaptor subunit [Gemmatimonadota bacterium]